MKGLQGGKMEREIFSQQKKAEKRKRKKT